MKKISRLALNALVGGAALVVGNACDGIGEGEDVVSEQEVFDVEIDRVSLEQTGNIMKFSVWFDGVYPDDIGANVVFENEGAEVLDDVAGFLELGESF